MKPRHGKGKGWRRWKRREEKRKVFVLGEINRLTKVLISPKIVDNIWPEVEVRQ